MSDLFKKILIATDGSQYTQGAIDEGLALARFHGAKVLVAYVIDTMALTSATGLGSPENIYEVLEKEGKDAVRDVKERARGLDVETAVLQGHPAHAIIQFAQQKGVDLIVVGSLGKSGIEEFLLGSVADKVIRHASAPVLVVRGKK